MRSSRVNIPTPDGTADAFVVRPDIGGPYPGVLLNMDGVGLRPTLEQLATRFASHGYVVLVPNAFYRAGRAPVIPLEKLRTPDRSEATLKTLKGLIGDIAPAAAVSDVRTWIAFLDGQSDVGHGPMGTVGYCMGGGLALRAAAAFPDRIRAVATLHGGNLATAEETSPHRLLPQVQAELYVGHAYQDGTAPPEQQERLRSALQDAGLTFEAEQLQGARHGFTMADLPAYDEAAAERHVDKVVALFDRTLKA